VVELISLIAKEIENPYNDFVFDNTTRPKAVERVVDIRFSIDIMMLYIF
jgi:hypothetical protein